jgi:hypothetical protein
VDKSFLVCLPVLIFRVLFQPYAWRELFLRLSWHFFAENDRVLMEICDLCCWWGHGPGGEEVLLA